MRNPTTTRRTAGALGVIALAAAGATGTTWAAFSDFAVIPDNAVGAATVVVGDGDPGYDLTVDDLTPGVPTSVSLTVKYAGTIAADIALDIDPSTSTWCTSDGTPRAGGQLQVSIDGQTWNSYCDLGEAPDVNLATGLSPGGETTVTLHLRLTDGTDHRYSELTSTDPLTVTAVQTNGGRAFTDYATGTLTVGAAAIAAPEPPSECTAAELDEFPADRIIVLTDGDDTYEATGTPAERALGYLILGLGGNDTIIGSNGRDCIVGGPGDDVLAGGNQGDVLLGGDGNDDLDGGNQDDVLVGGAGDDVLDGGENGTDHLYGGSGNDVLVGGNGQDVLDGGPGDDTLDGGNGKDRLDGGDGADTCVPDTSPPDEIVACNEPQSEELTSLRLSEPEAAVAPQPEEPATGEGTGAAEQPTGKTAAEEPAGEVPSEEPAGDEVNLPTETLLEEPVDKEPLAEAPPEASDSPEPPAADNPVSDNATSAEPTSEDPLPEGP